jgi:rRNA maturation endonuclease Nob1
MGFNMNNNVCESCETTADNDLIYDTGVCGICGANAECRDDDLISLYRGIGFDNNFISAHLPRLRHCGHDDHSALIHDLADALHNTPRIIAERKTEELKSLFNLEVASATELLSIRL